MREATTHMPLVVSFAIWCLYAEGPEATSSSSRAKGLPDLRCPLMATRCPAPLFDSTFVGAENNHSHHKDVIYARVCPRVAIFHPLRQVTAGAAGERSRPPEGSLFRRAIW